jgi:hypothetical protein
VVGETPNQRLDPGDYLRVVLGAEQALDRLELRRLGLPLGLRLRLSGLFGQQATLSKEEGVTGDEDTETSFYGHQSHRAALKRTRHLGGPGSGSGQQGLKSLPLADGEAGR